MTDTNAARSDYGTRLDAHTIRFERDLPGPIDRVWSYLTESDLKATWIAPGEIPRHVGGERVVRWEGEDGAPGGELRIRTRVYDPPHVLEYDWVEQNSPTGAIRDSVVRFELAEHGERVRLTLTHRALPITTFSSVGAGWHAHLDVLAAVLAGIDGPDADTRYEAIRPEYDALVDRGMFDAEHATIRFTRRLPGPIHRVWSFLTDGERLATWLTKSGSVPQQVGASFVLRMAGDDEMPERDGAEAMTYGTVRVYDPPHALEYTWGVKKPDGALLESVVRFELATDGEEVGLTLTHTGVIPGFESRTLGGWHSLLDTLHARLDNREPAPFMEAFRAIEETYRS
jgi:uncharacterized protein YndB with AHSA1/START domain